MAFSSEDLYTLSGGVNLFNYWQPFVTKHDTSSFYNWEQDNLPLYDLEERTYYLWEKFGYPLSAVPSMALVVSSSIDTTLDLSTNMFTSIQDAVDALPEIIRMPTLIEVAVSGGIGAINLNNIKCEDDGVLEIVNRGFAPLRPTEKAAYHVAPTDAAEFTGGEVSGLSALDVIDNTSALSVSANTANLFTANGVNGGYVRALYQSAYSTSGLTNGGPRPGYTVIAANTEGGSDVFRDTDNIFEFREIDSSLDTTIGNLDLSTISETDGSTEYKHTVAAEGGSINGFITANALSSIQVENSDGPIYIRGFVVDGDYDDDNTHETDVGIKVYNSNNITLEYCAAIRCTTTGADIKNSNVNLRRGFGAVRNYDKNDRGTLKTTGLLAENSVINVVTDTYTSGVDYFFNIQHQDTGIHLKNSTLRGGDKRETNSVSVTLTDTTFLLVGFNNTGILSESSVVSLDGILEVFNNNVNIHSKGSDLQLEHLMSVNAQKEGVLLDSGSNLTYNKNAFSQTTLAPAAIVETNTNQSYLSHHNYNGTHLVVRGGSVYGTYVSGFVPNYATGEMFKEHHGASLKVDSGGTTVRTTKPGVVADGGKVDLFAPKMYAPDLAVGGDIPGVLGQAKNNGIIVIRASASQNEGVVSVIKGSASYTDQQRSANLGAIDGGRLFIHGPTVILDSGVGLLAQNNSTITISPHTDDTQSVYDASTWIGSNLDHTALEIHSTRSCMVADNNSEIKMIDCGDWNTTWNHSISPVGTDLGVTYSDADYESESTYSQNFITSAGCIQFYPNVMDNNIAVDDVTPNSNTRTFPYGNAPTGSKISYDSSTSSLRLIYNATYVGSDTNIRTFSTGGMCVRATNGSHIYVKNVNFPMGHVNADDTFLDPSASVAGCNDLRIWNIADTSRLTASYCSVSGVYPSFAGYTGPRSTYFSGTTGQGEDSSAVAYAGWGGLPDTSTLSVLDHFGSGVAVSAGVLDNYFQALGPIRSGIAGDDSYGPNSYENRGPFRLYFSVPAVARTLAYFSGTGATLGVNTEDNRPAQQLAQGYSLSGSVSANSDLSSMYPDMLRYDADLAAITTSGHFQMSALFPDVDRNQVVLDESAANLFANAKHCSTEHSGRKKFVTIHRATTSIHGEGHAPNVTGDNSLSGLGSGFKSSNVFDLGRDV